jgi:hypothetical protein
MNIKSGAYRQTWNMIVNKWSIIMKLRFFILFVLFINVNINVISQTLPEGFPKLMYVTAKSGLRERSEPSVNGAINRTLLYGEYIQVFSKQSNPVTIDGITDYWYSARYDSSKSDAWVFGGYLSEELPADLPVIMGEWDDVNNQRQYYSFHPSGRYAEGYKETDMGIWGKWSVNGNTLKLILDSAMNYVTIDPPDVVYVQITVIDRNNIRLKFPNGETVRLKRNRSGW